MNRFRKNTLETTKRTNIKTGMAKGLDLLDKLSYPFIDRRISNRRKNKINLKKITILVPCYNEERGIGKVIDNVPNGKLANLGYRTEVIVIDNNSTDNTIEVALEKGSKVVSEKNQGKGNAIRTGFKIISDDTKYVIMLDGDNTYKSNEIPRLIENLLRVVFVM
jgi:cellulose synthase/poly-beta-1,6-N-acetylglucosamine synthase-like glycosyltransferase